MCHFNDGIRCDERDLSVCQACGWCPAESERRIARILAERQREMIVYRYHATSRVTGEIFETNSLVKIIRFSILDIVLDRKISRWLKKHEN